MVINPDERERSRLVTVVGGMGLKTAAGGELTREIFSDARQGLIISREALTPEGRVILEDVRNAHPDLAVAFISGADGIPDSVDAILVGAFGHLIRPWPDQQLADLLKGGLGL